MVEHRNITAPNGSIENEFLWVYTLMQKEESEFVLQESEVALIGWKSLEEFTNDVLGKNLEYYVPQGEKYFKLLISNIEKSSKSI